MYYQVLEANTLQTSLLVAHVRWCVTKAIAMCNIVGDQQMNYDKDKFTLKFDLLKDGFINSLKVEWLHAQYMFS